MRRVTGSVDLPLTRRGETQARVLGLRSREHKLMVFAAPNTRSMETARRVTSKPHTAPWLKPWAMGEHEGKDLASERPKINERIVKRPDESPGVSPHSGIEGESFNQARKRIIGGVQRQQSAIGPKDKILNISSGRVLHIVHAWAANGRPEDGSIDKHEITQERGEFSKPGQLFHLEPGGLRPVRQVEKPGQYFAQHGETEWNSPAEGAK